MDNMELLNTQPEELEQETDGLTNEEDKKHPNKKTISEKLEVFKQPNIEYFECTNDSIECNNRVINFYHCTSHLNDKTLYIKLENLSNCIGYAQPDMNRYYHKLEYPYVICGYDKDRKINETITLFFSLASLQKLSYKKNQFKEAHQEVIDILQKAICTPLDECYYQTVSQETEKYSDSTSEENYEEIKTIESNNNNKDAVTLSTITDMLIQYSKNNQKSEDSFNNIIQDKDDEILKLQTRLSELENNVQELTIQLADANAKNKDIRLQYNEDLKTLQNLIDVFEPFNNSNRILNNNKKFSMRNILTESVKQYISQTGEDNAWAMFYGILNDELHINIYDEFKQANEKAVAECKPKYENYIEYIVNTPMYSGALLKIIKHKCMNVDKEYIAFQAIDRCIGQKTVLPINIFIYNYLTKERQPFGIIKEDEFMEEGM